MSHMTSDVSILELTESEGQRDVQQCADRWCGLDVIHLLVYSFECDLSAGKSEEKEEECAEKLADGL